MIRQFQGPTPMKFDATRLPLVALLAAAGMSAALACSSDDDSEPTESSLPPPESMPASMTSAAPGPRDPTPNGLSFPDGVEDWRVIGVVNIPTGMTPTLRVIVGNDTAVDAARAGQTSPWPEGSTMAHYQWAPSSTPESGDAITPGNFVALTMITKNSELYAADHNWAFGVWRGLDLVPPAVAEPAFDRACVGCHTTSLPPEKDFIFTVPGALPSSAAIAAAPTLSNGLQVPAGILDWRVIGMSSLATATPPTIRVIVGNDIAVQAARAGETLPWPDGSIIAQYVWTPGETPVIPAPVVSATEFAAFTLMVRDAQAYAADGGWAFGRWNGTGLTAPAAADFDRACVACHTERVAANDFVFTRPGALPPSFVSPLP